MNMSRGTLLVAAALLVAPAADRVEAADARGWYFPPPGEGLEQQQRRSPREVGLRDELIAALQGKASRWALWRHGYLVHVEGDWNKTQDVASLRKTWHAMTVGAAIQQGRIPTYCQPVRQWVENPGDERVTWWHLITQTSALDYPHAAHPDVGDPAPGEVWTYSDKNPRLLCNALARVYGKTDFQDNYADVAKAAYFDAIGMRGWSARPNQDGVRFHLDLEDTAYEGTNPLYANGYLEVSDNRRYLVHATTWPGSPRPTPSNRTSRWLWKRECTIATRCCWPRATREILRSRTCRITRRSRSTCNLSCP